MRALSIFSNDSVKKKIQSNLEFSFKNMIFSKNHVFLLFSKMRKAIEKPLQEWVCVGLRRLLGVFGPKEKISHRKY